MLNQSGRSELIATKSSAGGEIRLLAEQTSANATDGERKTMTDIKGSTELIPKLDLEETRAVIDPMLELMMDAVHRYDAALDRFEIFGEQAVMRRQREGGMTVVIRTLTGNLL